jgi:hemerythrin-like metal-binding protein
VSRIRWDATLETGDEAVDVQHHELVALFNEMHEAIVSGQGKDAAEPILAGLIDYVNSHFEAERQLMIAVGYPSALLVPHVEQHTDLARKTGELAAEYRAGRVATALPLANFLSRWLTSHIRESDRAFAQFMRESGTASV